MSFHKDLVHLNQWARYYTAKGIDTPLTDIDVEIIKINQSWNVFLLCYTEKEKAVSITMLLRTEADSIKEAVSKAVKHFASEELRSAPADPVEFKTWETNRLRTVEDRRKDGLIKEVKDSIFKEDKDMFKGLMK